jgi:hypothetical protein
MSNIIIHPNNFFLVLCKSRKKLDKYIKINKIKNKYIIDINQMLIEEEMTYEQAVNSDLFKILIVKRFNQAKEKKKDVYYIPVTKNKEIYSKLFSIKKVFKNTHNFNLLYFYEDFIAQPPEDIMNNISEFDICQILKDY